MAIVAQAYTHPVVAHTPRRPTDRPTPAASPRGTGTGAAQKVTNQKPLIVEQQAKREEKKASTPRAVCSAGVVTAELAPSVGGLGRKTATGRGRGTVSKHESGPGGDEPGVSYTSRSEGSPWAARLVGGIGYKSNELQGALLPHHQALCAVHTHPIPAKSHPKVMHPFLHQTRHIYSGTKSRILSNCQEMQWYLIVPTSPLSLFHYHRKESKKPTSLPS